MQTEEEKLVVLPAHELEGKLSLASLDSGQPNTLPAAGLSPASGVTCSSGTGKSWLQ